MWPMIRAQLLLLLLGLSSARGTFLQTSTLVTPWCKDSFRIQIRPTIGGAKELPISALTDIHCTPGPPQHLDKQNPILANGNLQVVFTEAGNLVFHRHDTDTLLFSLNTTMAPSSVMPGKGFFVANATLTAGDSTERLYGLGQGNWTGPVGGHQIGGCASDNDRGSGMPERVVPLLRNGQSVELLQRKFHITIPWVYSSAGYGFLFNMPGYGSVRVGALGVGGMEWHAQAAPLLDIWVTTLPEGDGDGSGGHGDGDGDGGGDGVSPAEPIYSRYADATGHPPPLREDAMIFWQSRLRYINDSIAIAVAHNYSKLDVPVGVLVIDYYNQVVDGDFRPDPRCYSLGTLTKAVRSSINASTMFSIWPEAKINSASYLTLKASGCLCNNTDLGGYAIDPTTSKCRGLIWTQFVKPNYFDEGVNAFWLDETDGEGTEGGDGNTGYHTSLGPPEVASNLWVNEWIRTFTEPVQANGVTPLVLTRGVWAGGQRNGVVLWSSDITSTFEELHAQINLGVHSSLSGIPWWTSDVGGFGCRSPQSNDTPLMRELIVRWYQFGLFSPIFRTHGCRKSPDPHPPPPGDPCVHGTRSCGGNEVWSYGPETQIILEDIIRMRFKLKPYIQELAANVTTRGVPTARPLWWEFPKDETVLDINDQYLLGPDLLVAPVFVQGARNRSVYFPRGARWRNFFDSNAQPVDGGVRMIVDAPLNRIPVYWRV